MLHENIAMMHGSVGLRNHSDSSTSSIKNYEPYNNFESETLNSFQMKWFQHESIFKTVSVNIVKMQ